MSALRDLFLLMRPYQWIKNGFVFIGILFAPSFLISTALLTKVVFTTIAFCFVSSAIYIINDMVDLKEDRTHPQKKFRPLAAGKVSISLAFATCIAMVIVGFCLGATVSYKVVFVLLAYASINLMYTYFFKSIVILDVFCISAGFMLRIMAGTYALDIPPSKWLLLCSMMLTLFLGFAKRRAELIASVSQPEESRRVLESYGSVLLDELISICLSGVIITYSLYTMSEETILIHKTKNLIYTVPFVIYALFRYIYLLNHRKVGEDPSKDIIRDPHIVISAFMWAVITFVLLRD